MPQPTLVLSFLAIAVIVLIADGRALQEQTSNAGECNTNTQTYLTGTYLSRYTDLAEAADCCQRCSSTPNCEIFAYCPADQEKGCFDGGSFESAGACTLYALDGEKPEVKQQGPQTEWLSGAPSGKAFPSIPKLRPGVCDPHPNTMLVGDQIQSTDELTETDCCQRCTNHPMCDVWSYCSTDPGDKCFTSDSWESGTACILYSLKDWEGEEAKVEQQGPDTLWIAGYREPDTKSEVPELNATAPDGCNMVPDTMLVTETRLGSFDDLQDAETCCERCRNTPACQVWNFCTGDAGDVCFTQTDTQGAGLCNLYTITVGEDKKSDLTVEQRGAETSWVSGLKWEADDTFSGTPPQERSCTSEPKTLKTGPSTLAYFNDIPTETDCCTRCINTPTCERFAYCPESAKGGCFSPSGTRDAGTCFLYELDGEAPTMELQGGSTLWVSGAPSTAA